MMDITIENIYRALDRIIAALQGHSNTNLASVLQHRLYKVAWNSRTEIFTELRRILGDAIRTESGTLPPSIVDEIGHILNTIDKYLAEYD